MTSYNRKYAPTVETVLTTTQRDALSSPPDGTVIYNSTLGAHQYRQGGAWITPYVVGGTDVAVLDGGTGASTAAGARTNLGVPTVRDYVSTGCVWTGDAYASTRVASMTAGTVLIGGVTVTVAAVTARTFTASRDTYVDVDNTGALTYSEVTNNNATSPALAANSVRLGIVVTGASNIAAAASINQGAPLATLPTLSSPTVPMTVSDSLGNLIYPRLDQRLLGFRQLTSNFTTTVNATTTDVTNLAVPYIGPASGLVRISLLLAQVSTSNATGIDLLGMIRTPTPATIGQTTIGTIATASKNIAIPVTTYQSFGSGAVTVKASVFQNGAGTLTIATSGSAVPAFLAVEIA